MSRQAHTVTTFDAENVIQPISTSGIASLDRSGRVLATSLGEDAVLTDLDIGKFLARIEGVSNGIDPSGAVG